MSDRPASVDPRYPTRIRKSLKIWSGTRVEQRRRLAKMWLREQENSRYRYDVELCRNGSKVYLLRPANLNKGFDFQINLEGFQSRSNEAPKHSDIINDLARKRHDSPHSYRTLRRMIDAIYECEEPVDVLKKHRKLLFRSGLPVDAILRVLKWMFIEQDITYWNYTGRRMLMRAISDLD